MFELIMYLILAATPYLGYMCFKTKTRAWITLTVFVFVIDVFVLKYLLSTR